MYCSQRPSGCAAAPWSMAAIVACSSAAVQSYVTGQKRLTEAKTIKEVEERAKQEEAALSKLSVPERRLREAKADIEDNILNESCPGCHQARAHAARVLKLRACVRCCALTCCELSSCANLRRRTTSLMAASRSRATTAKPVCVCARAPARSGCACADVASLLVCAGFCALCLAHCDTDAHHHLAAECKFRAVSGGAMGTLEQLHACRKARREIALWDLLA